MSTLTALVVPAAPALLPGLGGSADPLAELREQAAKTVAEALSAAPEAPVLVVAAGERTRAWDPTSPSGAARFTTGRVAKGALPAGLEIGRMFAPVAGGESVTLRSVAADAAPADCLALGRELAADGPVVLLVVADGPATLIEKAPGHLDPEAAPFARALGEALGHGDPAALAALDPAACERLWMRGRPALQVLAGAFEGSTPSARLILDEAPYGVQYLLARWDRRDRVHPEPNDIRLGSRWTDEGSRR